MDRDVKFALALMMVIGTLGPMGGNLILPMVSVLKNEFHTDVSMIMLSVTLFMVPFALVQFISGGLSDVYGRRPLITAGLAIYGLGFILASATASIWWFIAARVVQGAGNALAAPVLIAVIGDLTGAESRGRWMGVYSSALRTGMAIAPFVGGVMAYHWRVLFVAMGVLSFAVAACSWVCLGKLKGGTRTRGELVTDLKSVVRNRGVIALSAAGFVTFFSYVALMSITSDVLTSFPYFSDPNSVGLILSVSGAAGIVSASIAGFLTDKFGRRIVPATGAAVAALSLLALAAVTVHPSPLLPFYYIPNVLGESVQGLNPQTYIFLFTFQSIMRSATVNVFVYFLVLMSIMGLGISFIWPSLLALSVEIVPPHQRGTAASVFNGTRFLGYSIAPTVFASVYLQAGLDAAFLLSAAMLGLVVGVIYLTTGNYARIRSDEEVST
ncbi:MAG: MFS transporter [Candidatus Freyarchaeota archaeon]|nr:MFS transporter [Candidatus Jordarchaeia archaeon]